jgi:hypothetical protein
VDCTLTATCWLYHTVQAAAAHEQQVRDLQRQLSTAQQSLRDSQQQQEQGQQQVQLAHWKLGQVGKVGDKKLEDKQRQAQEQARVQQDAAVAKATPSMPKPLLEAVAARERAERPAADAEKNVQEPQQQAAAAELAALQQQVAEVRAELAERQHELRETQVCGHSTAAQCSTAGWMSVPHVQPSMC